MLKKRHHFLNERNKELETKKKNIINDMEKSLKSLFLEDEKKIIDSTKKFNSVTEDRNIERRREIYEEKEIDDDNIFESMMKLSI